MSVQIGCCAGFTPVEPVHSVLQSVTLFGNSGDGQHTCPDPHRPAFDLSRRHVPHVEATSATRSWHLVSQSVTSAVQVGSLDMHSAVQRASIGPSESPLPPPQPIRTTATHALIVVIRAT
jgi:hypothetical protein